MAFAQTWFAQFLASVPGRAVRVVAGVVIIGVGLAAVGGTIGTVLAIVGLVPLFAGVMDVCVISAAFGGPFRGQALRDAGRHTPASPTPGSG